MSAFDAQRHEQMLRDRINVLGDQRLAALSERDEARSALLKATSDVPRLVADLEQAREALRFYADEHRYRGHDPEVLLDVGSRARASSSRVQDPECGECGRSGGHHPECEWGTRQQPEGDDYEIEAPIRFVPGLKASGRKPQQPDGGDDA